MWYEKHSFNIFDFLLKKNIESKSMSMAIRVIVWNIKGLHLKEQKQLQITICSDFVISRKSKEKNRLVFNILRDINTMDTE